MRAENLHFSLTRQLSSAQSSVASTDGSGSSAGQQASAAMPQTMPMDSSLLYLGETCVFDVTLSNQGAPVSALTIKVECSVEGGSTAVLEENSDRPLQQLPFRAQEHLRVTTDIKEQGPMTIVASAVFTDQTGERKYHVQFFKFTAASPVSVRTRVRHLPHMITPSSSSSGGGGGCGVGITRCFLEVNVQNSTQLAMQLHAVRLLAAAGVAAQQIAALGQQQQQQQHAVQLLRQQTHETSHRQQHDQQQQQVASGKANAQPQLAPAGAAGLSSSDTELLQDIDYVGSTPPSVVPSVQQKQQHLHSDQLQQQQQPFPGQSSLTSATLDLLQQQQGALLPAGCSHNSLWQIDHHLAGPPAASSSQSAGPGPSTPCAAASGPSSSGSSSSTLGRLELQWSTCDGRTGRLLTQPLTGPVPASGKEVLMQLCQLVPQAGVPAQPGSAAAAGGVGSSAGSWAQSVQLASSLAVNQPFTATFTLTAGPHDMGPLLVLYTSTVPPPPSSGTTSSTGGLNSSSSAQLVTDSSSIQARRFGGAASSSGMSGSDAVVVEGSRSTRVAGLAAGQSVTVPFQLLALRRGWLRLPTFVVASEADGRLLDGVHDVHVLVV